MENNYDSKIENLKNKIQIKYIQAIIKQLGNDGSNYHLNDLQKIMLDLKNNTKVDKKKQENNSTKTNLFNNIDQYMFNKPWNRLPEVHKLLKMKDYVNNSLIIYDNSKKEKLMKELFSNVKKKNLTRKGSVNYDHVNCRIISIPSLKYDKNKEEYYLNL